MIRDIRTVLWIEWKQIFPRNEGLRSGWANLAAIVIILGIFLPLQFGTQLVRSPLAAALWIWFPLLLIIVNVSDSFAGERERHTLETLLSSRLPDRSILIGKIAAGVGYGWGISILCMFLGLAAINVIHWRGHFVFYSLGTALAILLLSFLISCLASEVGVLVSLHASTVRQATQTLGFSMMAIWLGFVGLSYILPKTLKAGISSILKGLGLSTVVILAIALFMLIDGFLFIAAQHRFRRARLLLD